MTGFGRAAEELDGARLAVTVQGWNHRYLDLVFRLPDELRPLESTLRERVAARILRGRCEIGVRLEVAGDASAARSLDRAALDRFLRETLPLVEAGTIARELRLGDLVRSPFLVAAALETARPEALEPALLGALDRAFAQFDESRATEGAKLSAALAGAWNDLRDVVRRLGDRRAEMGAGVEEALRRRLEEILPDGARELPPERLAQEVALLAEKSDVREELERLAAHLDHFESLRRGEGPHGRRLEFVTQELLRELNTIGAKSRDVETTRLVMAGKVANEQLREQVQNVE